MSRLGKHIVFKDLSAENREKAVNELYDYLTLNGIESDEKKRQKLLKELTVNFWKAVKPIAHFTAKSLSQHKKNRGRDHISLIKRSIQSRTPIRSWKN